jgi:hypothetical protein
MSASGKIAAELHADTRAIYERLRKCAIGDVVSYDELQRLTRRDIKGRDRYVLTSALRLSLRDGRAFGCVRGQGVKLLNDGELIAEAESVTPRIRRLSRRAAKKLAAVRDFDKLPNAQKVRHNTLLSMFGALAAFSREGTVRKVEREVARQSQSLSLTATLEAFADD